MAASNRKILIIVAILFVVVIAIVSNVESPFARTASVTSSTNCDLFVDVDGKTYETFSQLRNEISDMSSMSNEALQSYGLIEKSDGVYLCQ